MAAAVSDFSSTRQPAVTVVVVSDYRPGEPKSWNDLRAALASLAQQEFDEPVEYLLVENVHHVARLPADVGPLLPAARIIAIDSDESYALKNAGIQAARADLVMVLDADCTPQAGWIRAGANAMRSRPDAVAISGRTTYPGRSTLERSLGLLSRAYVDLGTAGRVRLLSTNNMIVRRRVFASNPLPTGCGPLAYRLLTERLLGAGGALYFEPAMRTVHDFEGWSMERDMRRQVGWTSIRIRQLDFNLPGATVVRALGPLAVPLLYGYRVLESIGHSLRLPQYFGLDRRHIPLLVALAAIVHFLEVPGMLRALAGRQPGPTVYR